MTQLFDEESGGVTPGHRDRGGPVPRRRRPHAGRRRLRGRPARLGAGRRPQDLEGRARPPRQGRRRRRVPPSRRVPRALRGRGAGRERHGRDLPAGRQGEGLGHRHRQGLPGHDQAPQLQPRPGHARLAQRPQAGLDRRLGDAVARLQGHEDGRPDGRQARHPGRASPSTRSIRERNLLLVKGAVPGPKNGFVEIREDVR